MVETFTEVCLFTFMLLEDKENLFDIKQFDTSFLIWVRVCVSVCISRRRLPSSHSAHQTRGTFSGRERGAWPPPPPPLPTPQSRGRVRVCTGAAQDRGELTGGATEDADKLKRDWSSQRGIKGGLK